MRCFVPGAHGFIGRHVTAALVEGGWSVTGGARNIERACRLIPDIDWIAVDFNRDGDADGWRQRLAGFDAVVNCVGVLQSGLRDRSHRVHVEATVAMFRGAAAAGVTRGVHISALGADRDGRTEFARDKAEADAQLLGMDGGPVVLRPSLVYARDSYGGTAMLRALAGLPGNIPLPSGNIAFEPIHATDLAQIVVRCLDGGLDAGPHEIGGPARMTLGEIIAELRRWLGFAPARFATVPRWVMQPLLWLGDLAGWLGAPSAFRSTTFAQARATPAANADAIRRVTGVAPRPMRIALAAEPAGIQDRLHARLGFAVPALRMVLGLFWLASGVIALLPGPSSAAREIAEAAGVAPAWSALAVLIGSLIDMALGAAMTVGVRVRPVALLQAAVAAAYVAFLGTALPELWLDPLGALVKALPVIFASLVVAAAAEER